MGEFTKDKLDELLAYSKYILRVLMNGSYTLESILLAVIYFGQYLTYVYSEEKVKKEGTFMTGDSSVYKTAPYEFYSKIVKLRNELIHLNKLDNAIKYCNSIIASLKLTNGVKDSFEEKVINFIGVRGFEQIRDLLTDFEETRKDSILPNMSNLIKGE